MVEAQIILLNFNNVRKTNGNRGDTMNIELKEVVIKIEDAEFVFQNTGLNGFFDVEEKRAARDIKGCIALVLAQLIRVSNVKIAGVEVDVEGFKAANLPTDLALKLFREYADALAADVIGDTKEMAAASIKNEELPIDLSGVSTSLN